MSPDDRCSWSKFAVKELREVSHHRELVTVRVNHVLRIKKLERNKIIKLEGHYNIVVIPMS